MAVTLDDMGLRVRALLLHQIRRKEQVKKRAEKNVFREKILKEKNLLDKTFLRKLLRENLEIKAKITFQSVPFLPAP